MDEIDGLAKGSRCTKRRRGKDGVMRCAKFAAPGRKKKASKSSRRKASTSRKRRPANKGKVCIRFRSVDGVKRCAKFGTKGGARKTTKRKPAKRKTSARTTRKPAKRKASAKKPAKRRASWTNSSGGSGKATVTVDRATMLTFGGKIRKGCRPKPNAKGKLLCRPDVVDRVASRGGQNTRSASAVARGAGSENRRGFFRTTTPFNVR